MRSILLVLSLLLLAGCGAGGGWPWERDGGSDSSNDGGDGGGGGGGGASANADLAALVPSAGAMSPAFDAATMGYGLLVSPLVSTVTLTPIVADAGATVTVEGVPVTSGGPSVPIDVVQSDVTPIVVEVTAADGVTTRAYVVVVLRLATADQEAYLKQPAPTLRSRFGVAVAMSGNTLAVASAGGPPVGLQTNPEVPGGGHVFVRTETGWADQALLLDGRRVESVSISGDSIVFGVPTDKSGATGIDGDSTDTSAQSSGAAYVFVRTGSIWTQQAYLKPSNTDTGDRFGESVSISGDTVVVGAPGERSTAVGVDGDQADDSAQGAGAAYVFVRTGTIWAQEAYLKASNTEFGDAFGSAMGISGDTLVVGAPGEDSGAAGIDGDEADDSTVGAGAAYVFVRSGTAWMQQAYVKSPLPGMFDSFGTCVAISGDSVAIGAPQEGDPLDHSGEGPGAAYVFVRSGGAWSEGVLVNASDSQIGHRFGSSIALAGDQLVVGVFREFAIGAAYAFVRTGAGWLEKTILEASHGDVGDEFGASVAVSGDVVAVGAPSEDSNAAGVGGDQENELGPNQGAVYVFR